MQQRAIVPLSASLLTMLSCTHRGTRGPFLIFLHWLSGSSRTWHDVAEILARRGVQCVCIDLPGFGDANASSGFTVREMRESVIETVTMLRAEHPDEPWVIAGHSMGGKIAAVVAREAASGRNGLQNLRGAMLVSPSPPAPEPMEESNRLKVLQQLGESTGDAEEDRTRAKHFLSDNTGKLPLSAEAGERGVMDLLRMNRTAFRAWMESGSKEDWSATVGKLPIPAMILAGSEEPALGPDVQRAKTLPHFTDAEVIELEGCGHLAPLERPFELAEYACSFLVQQGFTLEAEASQLGSPFSALLESDRVSSQTRSAMETRLEKNSTWNHTSTTLTDNAFRTLRALAESIVPNAGFDVAAAVDSRCSAGEGDGWRFAALPDDIDALRKGFASLDIASYAAFHVPFVALHAELRKDLLRQAAAGELGKGLLGTLHVGEGANAFSGDEMKQWFEEMRGDFTKAYMAHPATMERVGYTGFADEDGFTQIQLGQQEEFER